MINQEQLRLSVRLLSPCLRASQITPPKQDPLPKIGEGKEICEQPRSLLSTTVSVTTLCPHQAGHTGGGYQTFGVRVQRFQGFGPVAVGIKRIVKSYLMRADEVVGGEKAQPSAGSQRDCQCGKDP
ncbi:hypothetical protein INR49_013110 [Caranx melampygus]|nr:hypothetical protein INR49_013110 [Caranx melampygus]